MPRLLLGFALALVLAAPADAACPGADPCPYAASAVVGQRAEGVLRFPQAVAVGPDGSVYVADLVESTRTIRTTSMASPAGNGTAIRY